MPRCGLHACIHAAMRVCFSFLSLASSAPQTREEKLAACKTSNFPGLCRYHATHAQWGGAGRGRKDHGAGRGPWRGRGRRAGKRRAAASPLRNAIPQPLLHSSAGKRHALVVVAVLQNEAPFVAEWLEYHRLPHVGVSHFYLYDDGSTDGLQAVLAPYVGAGLVTLHPIGVAGELPTLLESAVETPTCGGRHERFLQLGADGVCRRALVFPQQPAALRHAVKRYGDGAEWMAWIDVDEFLARRADAPAASESIAASLARRNGSSAASIQVPDTLMVPHLLRTDEGLVIETATAAAPLAHTTSECTPHAHPRGACRSALWSQHIPAYWPDANHTRRDRPRRPRMVFTHGETNTRTQGSGWWPKVVIRPAAFDTGVWTSIHSPPLRPPARQEASDELELAHFRVSRAAAPPRPRHPARAPRGRAS